MVEHGRDTPGGDAISQRAGWLERVRRAAEPDVRRFRRGDAERDLPKPRALFQTAFSHAPIGMAIMDLSGQILMANEALCRTTGYSPDELAERTIADLLIPEDRALDVSERRRLIAGEVSCYDASVRLCRADGSSVWVALTAAGDGDGEPGTLIYQLQDISERHELEGRLQHLVDHDLLTGLFNRHRFEQELTRQVQRHRRFGEHAAMLMVDLDGFKDINDQFGHAVGDELLRGLGASLRERSRATDVLARLSGDEFAILLPEADRKTAEVVATETLGLVRRHVSGLGSERANVTASVGVALCDGLNDGEVLALADAAMYAAKESGRDRFVLFEPSDPRPPHSRQVGEASRLRRALAEQRFVLHCQPVCNLAGGHVEMYELLIRMLDETGDSLVPPNAFLYAAERFGLIAAIDSWVVSQAVELIAEHARQGRRIVLCVNLSGRSISDPALDAHIDRALQDSGIDPSCLIFELTETAAIGHIEAAVAFSQRLRLRGCQFALDDFGAGLASFYYLKKLPFDFIKIDGDFVRGLPRSPVDQLVVSAIVTIARGMGKQTIAEFVTDQETSDLLLASGVDYAQGFHIAPPASVNDVLAARPL
jgi:diguanylate cyclase (GGDEF)-like protein/PAS domain S-box-containing protein